MSKRRGVFFSGFVTNLRECSIILIAAWRDRAPNHYQRQQAPDALENSAIFSDLSTLWQTPLDRP
ncbi:MAG: hypothetical protein AAF557_20565 [Pseudomonadota bacterium]